MEIAGQFLLRDKGQKKTISKSIFIKAGGPSCKKFEVAVVNMY